MREALDTISVYDGFKGLDSARELSLQSRHG